MKDWVRKAGRAVWSLLRHHWPVLTLAWVAVVIVIGLTMLFWPAIKSNGEALRNYALFVAAAIGLPLAVWRSCVAHKQANLQSKQADTAERGHNNERYQKGADMLGSDVMTTRMGGVYALERVAQEHPHEYHVQIMKLLCAFLQHRVKDGGEEAEAESKELRLDLNAAAQAIGECRRRLAEMGRLEDIEGGLLLDLRGANLSRANLSGTNLSGANLLRARLRGARLWDANLSGAEFPLANLWEANLSRANLHRANCSGANLLSAVLHCANLSHARLWGANLSGAHLQGADCSDAILSEANLWDANLSDANLSGASLTNAVLSDADFDRATGFSQEDLDMACQHPDSHPPKNLLDGLTWDEDAAKERWREVHGPRELG